MKTHTAILNKFNTSITPSAIRNFLIFVVTSFILIKSMGYSGGKGIDILFISLSLLLLSIPPTTRYVLVIPFIIFCAFYAPVGVIYGPPSVSVVSALFQTNRAEAAEFLHAIPMNCYLLPSAVLLMLFLLAHYCWRRPLSFRKALPFLLMLIVVLVARILGGNMESLKLVNFFSSFSSSYQSYNQQMAEIDASTLAQPRWVIDGINKNKANYVIIVGESMRRDYMSLFGYPTSTTPFLDHVNGTFYSNYISTAPNTFESLPRTLALSNGKKSYLSDNIVTLAKSAGLHTHWFSNQGLIGQFDTPVSKIAVFSDDYLFLKKGDYQSRNTDDDELLPLLQNALTNNEPGNLYVLHIMGSHSDFCERLGGEPPVFTSDNAELACYLSTYRKTDRFIAHAYQMLQETHSPFKLIYFSDHGLSHRNIDGKLYLRHGGDTRQNYEVPLVVLSDTDQQRTFIDEPHSAFEFISLFAQQAGIIVTHPQLHAAVTGPGKRPIFNGQEMVDFDQLANDPPELL
ncbi:phosphoethanolamine transferase [Serratia liquefaciens]|uniref:phosphoethanolamine transferase n=1 Tax=Serratia liquefaciens TaxID=614 RepID=UPI0022DD6A0B|nr:phosphoethanolamine transferase [Serratia liquefaciens]WBL74170.1 phosphoethanolamine transferase [Serratia liquefaciens]